LIEFNVVSQKLFLLLSIFSCAETWGQIAQSFDKRGREFINWSTMEASLSDEEKIELLSHLPAGETIAFEDANYDPEDDAGKYYDLDTAGLHYLDLDSDGDLDLIYQSLSGNMGRTSSRVYLEEDVGLVYKGYLDGKIYLIELKPEVRIHTYVPPCCDSYTNSIRTYTLGEHVTCLSNVVFICLGIYPGSLKLPDLESGKPVALENGKLFISPKDLRNGGYFRDKTREIHQRLRSGEYVICAELPVRTNALILDMTEVDDQKWYLVLTEEINKPTGSLYEDWQTRHKELTRYLGWTKEDFVVK